MASRVFAVLAAVFLVTAVGIAALAPLYFTLGEGILLLDRAALEWARTHSSGWVWSSLELPLLIRPLWLIPAGLGVICAGIASTLNSGKTSSSRRRRS